MTGCACCAQQKSQNVLNIESWTQVCSIILVWRYHLLLKIYVGPSVKNGRFFRFQNSAGVLVQPWIGIFISKFEHLPKCLKKNLPWYFLKIMFTLRICNIFGENFEKNVKFWKFSIFFFLKIPAGFTRQFWSIFWYVKICQNFLCATSPKIKNFIWDNTLVHKVLIFWFIVIFDSPT